MRLMEKAAEFGFQAARLWEEQGVLLLLRAYSPITRADTEGYALISPYYPNSHRAYRDAKALAEAVGGKLDSHLPLKPLAIHRGLTRMGRNCVTAHETYGSWIVLQAVILPGADAEAALGALRDDEPENPRLADACADCERCVRACPTNALVGDGRLRYERCLRAHMIIGQTVPVEYRALMGNRLIGCDICQQVCPMNASVCPVPETEKTRVPLAPLLAEGEALRAALRALEETLGKNTARSQRIRTQAALIAGNDGAERYGDALRVLAERGESEAIREHAAWALERAKA